MFRCVFIIMLYTFQRSKTELSRLSECLGSLNLCNKRYEINQEDEFEVFEHKDTFSMKIQGMTESFLCVQYSKPQVINPTPTPEIS